jgi:hypothetical protein
MGTGIAERMLTCIIYTLLGPEGLLYVCMPGQCHVCVHTRIED